MSPVDPVLVSCVVPVYNGEKFLAEAIESILGQSYPHVEVIVVDDGSADGTPGVIEGFGSRIRSTRQANQGPGAARNAGLPLATGHYISFLDADDFWYPDKLERQLARFDQRPELEVCFTQLRNIQATESIEGDPLLNPDAWPVVPFSPCTMLGVREAFDRVGLFDTVLRQGEDTEWFMRMMFKGIKYETMPEALVDRRIHLGNLTRANPPSRDVVVDMLKLVLDRRRAEGW